MVRRTDRRTNVIPGGSWLSAGAVVVAMLGCGGSEQGAMTADLERDLDLAINARPPQTVVVSALEGGPRNAPSGQQRGRRDAVPVPRRQPRPTPQAEVQETAATPEPEEAAAPAVAVTAQVEPTPAPIPEPAVQAPESDPVAGPASRGPSAGTGESDGQGDMGRGQGRRGGGWGTLIGVIIRGGSAGVDHCEEHDRPRRGRRNGGYGGDILAGGGRMGGGMGGVIGGVIGNGGIRPTFPRY